MKSSFSLYTTSKSVNNVIVIVTVKFVDFQIVKVTGRIKILFDIINLRPIFTELLKDPVGFVYEQNSIRMKILCMQSLPKFCE